VKEVELYWKKFVETGIIENLPDIIFTMIKSNFNFLVEPKWFYSALGDIEGICKRQNSTTRVTKRVLSLLNGMLIDNQDQRQDGTLDRGNGWCSALVAQGKLDNFSPLNKSGVREMTLLTHFENSLRNSGISAKVNINGYEYQWGFSRFDSKSIVLENNFAIELCGRPLQWRFVRHNGNAYDVQLDKFMVDAESFVKWRYSGYKNDNQRELLEEYGISDESVEDLRKSLCEVSSQLRNGIGDAFMGVLNKIFTDIGICDESVMVLVGFASAMLVTIGRNKEYPIERDAQAYITLVRLVKIYFEKKLQEDNHFYWRRLMREIVANMRLLSYLNVEII
jgi:hypothetical protein